MNQELWWIGLNEMKGISLQQKKKLLEKFKSPKNIFEATWLDFDGMGISKGQYEFAFNEQSLNVAEVIAEKNVNHEIRVLTMDDATRKGLSTEIAQWPIAVYYKGNVSFEKSTAVIGTRSMSAQGYYYCKEVAKLLAQKNVTVNSGFSSGIESTIIKNCIDNNSAFNVFLPHSLDKCNPKKNWQLMERTLEKDGLISPFSIEAKQHRFGYVERNALLAMWSDTLILVEASALSKTQSIINMGIDFDKSIQTIAGPDDSTKCGLNNQLLLSNRAESLDVHLNQSIKGLFAHPVAQLLRKESLGFDQIAKRISFDESELVDVLLSLEYHNIISVFANGKWSYNGW